MDKYKKVKTGGGFGNDFNEYLTKPGKYSIPIPNYSDDDSESPYEYINVDIRKVILPSSQGGKEESRLNVIIGYDEHGEAQAWYYNGAQQCYKRVFQDGVIGYLDEAAVEDFIRDDCEIEDEPYFTETVDFILSL